MLATLRIMRAALASLYADWLAVEPEPEYTLEELREDLQDHLRECCHAAGVHWQALTH